MQQPAYHNPFDLSSQQASFGESTNPNALINAFGGGSKANRDNSPDMILANPPRQGANAQRKKWNQPGRQQIEVNDFERDDEEESKTQKKQKQDQDDDDNYSDDDFDEPGEQESRIKDNYQETQLQSIQEHANESVDHSLIQDNQGAQGVNASSAHIEQFLKTATAEDMDIIRESLSNFAEVSKNFTNFKHPQQLPEEDQIEEDLEEDIPEDNNEEGSAGEEHKFEVIKKESAQGTRQTKKGRPVSAVYDLS